MIGHAVLAGTAGAGVMTIYVYLLAWLANRNWQVVHILSAVLSRRPLTDRKLYHTPLAVATFLHFFIGVLFAIIYCKLLAAGVTGINLHSAIVYGVLAGLLAMLIWWLTFIVRYQPPGVPRSSYLLVIGSSHVLFSVVMVLVMEWLS
ncbi:hypothetical protein F0L74_19445 [Chitinophaga agrisoli]|uniref:DUF1761 domain-containing protein n=1 Tax=Chitinophaga agrisoli TaxID=2607653 RepID=A0A5B2VIF0_9BACT|nr:hypothetical protein [Chitinophaga agrisoli]KAA2238408.1 hypothetical protein F0L74_19445 [Chitinophaga agrisoli]